MNQNFVDGFCKQAFMADDNISNSAADSVLGMLPLGTTLGTAFGERPEGHSRLKEFSGRLLGSIGGGLAGGAIARHPAGVAIGGLLGEGGASYLLNKKHYAKKKHK